MLVGTCSCWDDGGCAGAATTKTAIGTGPTQPQFAVSVTGGVHGPNDKNKCWPANERDQRYNRLVATSSSNSSTTVYLSRWGSSSSFSRSWGWQDLFDRTDCTPAGCAPTHCASRGTFSQIRCLCGHCPTMHGTCSGRGSRLAKTTSLHIIRRCRCHSFHGIFRGGRGQSRHSRNDLVFAHADHHTARAP